MISEFEESKDSRIRESADYISSSENRLRGHGETRFEDGNLGGRQRTERRLRATLRPELEFGAKENYCFSGRSSGAPVPEEPTNSLRPSW